MVVCIERLPADPCSQLLSHGSTVLQSLAAAVSITAGPGNEMRDMTSSDIQH